MVVGDRNGGKGAGPWTQPRGAHRRRRGARLALIAALAVMVPFIMASGAAAKGVPKQFFGTVPWLKFQGADYQRLVQAHVHNARTPFFWPTIEPTKGNYDWKATDYFVGTLALYHVRVLPFLNGSPGWVTNDTRQAPVKSKKAKRAWTQFVKACVKRYGPKGEFWRTHSDVPKVPITAWQIWNEPNLENYLKAKKPEKTYAKLVKISDKAISKADKHAKTILAGLSGNPETKQMAPQRFLKKFLKARGIKKHFDAAALHPYAPSIKKFKKLLNGMHKALKKKGAGRKQLWITEMGWGSAPPAKGKPLLKGTKGQNQLLKKSFRMLLHKRKKLHIKHVYWFLWRDADPNGKTNCTFCKSSGLFRYDFSPKPSWKTFLSFSRR